MDLWRELVCGVSNDTAETTISGDNIVTATQDDGESSSTRLLETLLGMKIFYAPDVGEVRDVIRYVSTCEPLRYFKRS